jgi:hypothetical protein
MQLRCPQCLGALVTTDGQTARCSIHGGEYKILFNRETLKVMENVPLIPSPGTEVSPPASAAVQAMKCVQHSAVAATQQCCSCGAYMCATCDFTLPNGMHLCPACATRPQTGLGERRKRSMIWSYVCAGGATLGFVLFLVVCGMRSGRSKVDEELIGVMATFVILIPSIVGLGMGLGTIDRRYNNPVSLWAATIWNGVILGTFLLMCIAGLMMK